MILVRVEVGRSIRTVMGKMLSVIARNEGWDSCVGVTKQNIAAARMRCPRFSVVFQINKQTQNYRLVMLRLCLSIGFKEAVKSHAVVGVQSGVIATTTKQAKCPPPTTRTKD
jgi:hypothetical protein